MLVVGTGVDPVTVAFQMSRSDSGACIDLDLRWSGIVSLTARRREKPWESTANRALIARLTVDAGPRGSTSAASSRD